RVAVVQLPRGERVHLEEGGAGIDEAVDPLARRPLAARAMAFHCLLAAPGGALRRALAHLGDELCHPLLPVRELLGVAVELRGQDGHVRSLTGASARSGPLTEW